MGPLPMMSTFTGGSLLWRRCAPRVLPRLRGPCRSPEGIPVMAVRCSLSATRGPSPAREGSTAPCHPRRAARVRSQIDPAAAGAHTSPADVHAGNAIAGAADARVERRGATHLVALLG